jgi:hypothetical protein
LNPISSMRLGILGVLMVLSAVAAGAQVTQGGSLPSPLPLFPSDNWWNVDVSTAPLDAKSSDFINFIGAGRSLHPDLGGDTGDSSPNSLTYGMPYVVVPGSQPLRQVVFDYADESDYAAPGQPSGYPIPDQARTETRWIEGGLPGDDPNADGDRHMLIVDRDHRVLFELYALRWNEGAGRWDAGSGAIFPLDSNHRRPEGWTSADAAGLAILPGLIRYDEANGATPIRHAFRFTTRSTNGHVYPASHTAGGTSGAPPLGTRLRLKAAKDISGYPPAVQRIFQAMKTYGLIDADNGSDMYIGGTYDTRWNNDILNPAFSSLKASDFEVIQLGWKPGSTPVCSSVTITAQPSSLNITAGAAATLSVAATGTAPLRYQWYTGNTNDASHPIAGATASILTVFPSTTSSYWVAVSNDCSTRSSDTAVVTVTAPCTSPHVSGEPLDQTVARGSSATLQVSATGSAPLRYQWYVGTAGDRSSPVAGATSALFTTPKVVARTTWWVEVRNTCGSANSRTVVVSPQLGRRRAVRR